MISNPVDSWVRYFILDDCDKLYRSGDPINEPSSTHG